MPAVLSTLRIGKKAKKQKRKPFKVVLATKSDGIVIGEFAKNGFLTCVEKYRPWKGIWPGTYDAPCKTTYSKLLECIEGYVDEKTGEKVYPKIHFTDGPVPFIGDGGYIGIRIGNNFVAVKWTAFDPQGLLDIFMAWDKTSHLHPVGLPHQMREGDILSMANPRYFGAFRRYIMSHTYECMDWFSQKLCQLTFEVSTHAMLHRRCLLLNGLKSPRDVFQDYMEECFSDVTPENVDENIVMFQSYNREASSFLDKHFGPIGANSADAAEVTSLMRSHFVFREVDFPSLETVKSVKT